VIVRNYAWQRGRIF